MAGSQDTRLLHVDYRDEFGRSTSSGIAIGIGPKISEEHWGSAPWDGDVADPLLTRPYPA